MTNQDIVQHLKQAQREATENKAIEEIPKAELDQIVGAMQRTFYKTWPKSF